MSDDGPNVGQQQALLNSQISAANAGGGSTDSTPIPAAAFERGVLGISTTGADGDVANLSKFSSGLSMQAAAPGAVLNGESLLSKIVGEMAQILSAPIEDHTAGVGGSAHGEGIAAGPAGEGGGSAASDSGGEGGGGGGGDVQARVYTGAEHVGGNADVSPPPIEGFTAQMMQARGAGGRSGGGGGRSSGGEGGGGRGA